jgi:hypothetical protein
MAGVRGDIRFSANLTQVGSTEVGTPKLSVSIDELLTLVAGTDATNKADILFQDAGRSLAASANADLDLAGSLSDAFGATIAAAEIVLLFFRARSTNVNNLQVKAAASNGFTGPFLAAGDGVSIKPGEWAVFVSQAGWPVTAGTGDLINVANSGAGSAVLYDVVIVGRTVAA